MVQHAETREFAKVWNHNGVVVPLDDVHIAFATDFAQVILTGFVQYIQQMQKKALEAKKEEPLVKLEEA